MTVEIIRFYCGGKPYEPWSQCSEREHSDIDLSRYCLQFRLPIIKQMKGTLTKNCDWRPGKGLIILPLLVCHKCCLRVTGTCYVRCIFLNPIHNTFNMEAKTMLLIWFKIGCQSTYTYEPVHEISNNVICSTSKASGQPAHMPSLIRAYACGSNILWVLSYWLNTIWGF